MYAELSASFTLAYVTVPIRGTVTVFGTPSDVTLSELALEMLFPANEKTAVIARTMAAEAGAAD